MGEETQLNESSLLTIRDVTRAHAGLYQCTASNGIALPASVNLQLVVQCEFIVFIFRLRQEGRKDSQRLIYKDVRLCVNLSVNKHIRLLLCCVWCLHE